MSKFNPFKSTIFNKIVVAITGLVLVLFIIGHLAGNLLVFFGRDAFNSYAHFLHSTGELLLIARIGLLVCLLLHIVTSIKLKMLNNAAKPKMYAVKGYVASTIFSRSMPYSGLAIFFFVIYHLLHFTAYVTNPDYGQLRESYGPRLETASVIDTDQGIKVIEQGGGIFERHDAYKMVIEGFSNPIVVIVYVLAVFFLAMHLNHAIQSMFQTLGFNGPRLMPRMKLCSKVIAWAIFVGFASIPLSVLVFGLGKGVIG